VKLVPVIDLAGGAVVRAVRGERERYRPIESRLCGSHDPVVVAARLAQYTASDTLYVADLDAIRGGSLQATSLERIAAAVPGCTVWLDAGFTRVAAAEALRLHGRFVPVFGSESLQDTAELSALAGRTDVLLSLDQRGGAPLDPAGCWSHAEWWPARVIVMTLDRVGAGAGPDLATFARVSAMAGARELIGAGGIRNEADLQSAQRAGAAAWLVASALHDLTVAARAAAVRQVCG
jgi:phosphoribosylformimino-5-aminoimidazole carboxamide ribotide isomerase